MTQDDSPLNEEQWNQGLTLEEFIEQMTHLQSEMIRRVRDLRLTPFERNLFGSLEKPVRVAVLTEDYCPDSLMNVPILAQIARCAEPMDVRVFIRHEWPDLQAHFEERGIERFPVFFFMDEQFREIGTWVERPKLAHERLAAWKRDHTEMAEISARTDLAPDEKRKLLQPIRLQMREDMEDWYDQGLQSETASEIRVVLQGYLDE